MRYIKLLIRLLICLIASFFIAITGDTEILQTGNFSQEIISVWLVVFLILITWRWSGKFVKFVFVSVLFLIGINNRR